MWTAFLFSSIDIMEKFAMPACPECDAELVIPVNAMENELMSCPDCGTELEIISLSPVQVERAPEVEEDWGE
jgi:alpha-aminoadipate carrier protein LysW